MREPARFNPDARADLLRLGQERTPVVIIDDALADPQALIGYARTLPFQSPQRTQYPGLNATLSKDIAKPVIIALAPVLQQVYGFMMVAGIQALGYFGLVTARPGSLTAAQSIPHYDRTDPRALAILLYLCDADQGGTGFYRHQPTSFERIDAVREPAYHASLNSRTLPAAGVYFSQSGDGFEMIGNVEARMNRIAIYPSNLLHSGLVDETRLSDDPMKGRLTANIFIA